MRTWNRRPRRRPGQNSWEAMRFTIGDKGEIYFPSEFLGRPRSPSEGANLRMLLPRTRIDGATTESVEAAAASGEMNDLVLVSGDPVFVWHDAVTTFDYRLSPIPGLTLVMGPDAESELYFDNAVIVDWATDMDYSPGHPNEELVDFHWDGEQHFLLNFLYINIIVRADYLKIGCITR